MLTTHDIAFLKSDRARAILADYATRDLSDANTLRLIGELRKSLSMNEAAAILSTLRLRIRAKSKFPRYARDMLFTDDGLQQASHPLVRRYRAQSMMAQSVLDLCCGIGGDSLALAAAAKNVLGVDIDAVRIAIARHNAEVTGLHAQFAVADVRKSIPSGFDGIFFDPARRDEQGRRIHHVERYVPPLSLVQSWSAREIVVKLSPAVDLRQLAPYNGALEFISAKGQLAEAVLWLKRPTAPPGATLLTDDDAHHLHHREIAPVEITAPRSWLFEPDPSVMRAGLVRQLAHDLQATMLDASIAYLTAEQRRDTPWGRYWRVLDWMPFQLKRLRHFLMARDIGRVTVKKRGFPMSPEELIARLRLKGGGLARVLVMTRHRGAPIVIICDEPSFGRTGRIVYNDTDDQSGNDL